MLALTCTTSLPAPDLALPLGSGIEKEGERRGIGVGGLVVLCFFLFSLRVRQWLG